MITDECWLYAGPIHTDDYGLVQVKVDGKWKLLRAHRVVYESEIGLIPDRMVSDHLCRVRSCINPKHIEIVTNAENTRRAHAWLTHCKQGHLFDEANTIIIKATGHRRCRQCQLANQRRYNYKRPGRKQPTEP
jgi:hypothetical protein